MSIFDGVPGFRIGLGAGDADEEYEFGFGLGDEPGDDALRLGTPQLGDATGFVRAGIAIANPLSGGLGEVPSISDVLPAVPALPEEISPQIVNDLAVTVTDLVGDVNVLPNLTELPALPDITAALDVVANILPGLVLPSLPVLPGEPNPGAPGLPELGDLLAVIPTLTQIVPALGEILPGLSALPDLPALPDTTPVQQVIGTTFTAAGGFVATTIAAAESLVETTFASAGEFLDHVPAVTDVVGDPTAALGLVGGVLNLLPQLDLPLPVPGNPGPLPPDPSPIPGLPNLPLLPELPDILDGVPELVLPWPPPGLPGLEDVLGQLPLPVPGGPVPLPTPVPELPLPEGIAEILAGTTTAAQTLVAGAVETAAIAGAEGTTAVQGVGTSTVAAVGDLGDDVTTKVLGTNTAVSEVLTQTHTTISTIVPLHDLDHPDAFVQNTLAGLGLAEPVMTTQNLGLIEPVEELLPGASDVLDTVSGHGLL